MAFDLAKQVQFALAKTLTEVAKEARDASVQAARKNFTIRNNWLEPSNARGIKALPASKTDLESAVATRADWLIPGEVEGEKVSPKRHIAIARAARPTKTAALKIRDLPKQLSKTFTLTAKDGKKYVAIRKGRGKNRSLRLMYQLVDKRVKLKKTHVFFDPIVKTVEKRFDPIFFEQLRRAIATAKR
jgi:hypothetical protein